MSYGLSFGVLSNILNTLTYVTYITYLKSNNKMVFYTRNNFKDPLIVLFINRMLIYYSYKHIDRIKCCIFNFLPYATFPQGCPIQQLIALRVFVVESSCLQFWNGR